MHAEAVKNSEKLYHRSGTSSGLAAPFDDWDCYSFPGAGSSVTLGADATAPGGFAEDELARVSRSALLSPKDCASIIREAEAVGAWQESGRVAHYARQAGCLTPLSALPQSVSTLSPFLATTLFPAIREAFPCGCGSASLRVSDARLVKYNASASQTQLGMHRDGPLVTATIALNGLDEYAGGGTLIEALAARDEDSAAGSAAGSAADSVADSVADSAAEPTGHVRVPTGHVVLHPGAVRHGGNPITSGLRCAAAASFQPFSSAVWSGSCRALEAPTAQGCLPWMLPAVPAARCACCPLPWVLPASTLSPAHLASHPPDADVLVFFIFDAAVCDYDRYCVLKANGILAKAQRIKSGSDSTYRSAVLRDAVATFRDAIALGAATEVAHVGLGEALLELGRYAEDAAEAAELSGSAVDALLTAVTLSPTNAHSLSTLSAALERINLADDALQAAAAAAAADPSSTAAHNNHGLLLARLGRHEEAIRDGYILGLELDPHDAEILCNIATSTSELGDHASAASILVAALESDPTHARAKANLAALQAVL